ncbi:MAG: hypothetical protein LBI27_08690 [Clostridiales bacterium]|nr:hypothetical protein [Clostridiales bacterium]
MQILFDLQQQLEDLQEIDNENYIVPIGDFPPRLSIRIVDDVKTILISERVDQVAGLGIPLDVFPKLREGDRVTVTGRVPRESPAGSWGVALCSEESKTRKAEECQLAQTASPKSLFSLSYILNRDDLKCLLMVQTTRWGAINPIMDLNIDNILILRERENLCIVEDIRDILYSFDKDKNLQPGGAIAEDELVHSEIEYSHYLAKSGNPDVKIFLNNGEKAIYVSERNKDWDGIDINLEILDLYAGNKYHVNVMGRIDGFAPEDAIVTLQGIPGYSWRNNQTIESNQVFTLSHTLSHAEIEWTTLRITTNAAGATVPFYIYGIEIKMVGLL